MCSAKCFLNNTEPSDQVPPPEKKEFLEVIEEIYQEA